MRIVICIFVVLIVAVAAAQTNGVGSDIPTSLSCASSLTDPANATCTFNTVNASDTELQIIDYAGGSAAWYNPAMCTPSAGVCPHTININHLLANNKYKYMAHACTHTTSPSGTRCPRTAPDLSSTGPSTITAYNNIPILTTNPNPSTGTLSSWFSFVQAPSNVFQGQSFFIDIPMGITVGSVTNYYMLLNNVSVNGPSGLANCGTPLTVSGTTYNAYGNAAGTATCSGGPAASDWTIVMTYDTTWSSSNALGLDMSYTAGLLSSGNVGYKSIGGQPPGTIVRIFVKPGASVPAGSYTVSGQLQPLFSDGTGNGSGGALVSQAHTFSATFNVNAVTPIASTPPSSFPAWSFLPQHLAMASYWGTWECSNTTEIINSGAGPWALNNNSGVYENIWFTVNTWGVNWPWNYDGRRNNLAIGDLLFATTHPAWAASHTYTIGDMVTSAGTTYIMNAVNGASSPGLSGVSSGGISFNNAPGAITPDATLQWMSVGNLAYWQGCSDMQGNGYRDVMLLNQATNMAEPYMFPVGMAMHAMRTQDAAAGDYTGYSYTENQQRFGTTVLNPVATMAVGAAESSGPGYWKGGDTLALTYGASKQAEWGVVPNDNNMGQFRIKGCQLNMQDAYWAVSNNPAWITTDDGLRTQRMVDTALADLDMGMNVPDTSLVPAVSTSTGTYTWSPFYQFSQVAEGLLDYYLLTVQYSNTTIYPGSTVVPDERIPVALHSFADWAWVYVFDREYDKNQSVADHCTAVMCQTTRRLHSYSFPYALYNPVDARSYTEFGTEADSNSELAWIYAWLWARNNVMTPPSNGRITVSSYADIARVIMQHGWDGRHCIIPSASAPTAIGYCDSWGVADYYNGGRTANGAGFKLLVTAGKQVNQSQMHTNSLSVNWLSGLYTWQQDSLSKSTNPCWVVGNRNTDGSCNAPSPYADVQQPYTINLGSNGGKPQNISPSVCPPGTVQNVSFCGTSQTIGTTPNVVLSNPLTCCAATISFFTVKKTTQCSFIVGTGVSQTTATRFDESPTHTPLLIGGTPLPLWFHTITATGLTASTKYHYGLACIDSSSNQAFLIYQVSSTLTPPTYVINYATTEQANTFTTLSNPFTPGGGINTPHVGPGP